MEGRQIPVEWLPHYTYADYAAWESDWELIYGIPYFLSLPANRLHQSTGRKLILLIQYALNQEKDDCGCEVYHGLD